MSKIAKAAWKRWENVFTSERKLFIAEMMAYAIDSAKSLNKTGMSGAEKRDALFFTLMNIAAKHALVLAGKIAAEEVKNLIGIAIENSVLIAKNEK